MSVALTLAVFEIFNKVNYTESNILAVARILEFVFPLLSSKKKVKALKLNVIKHILSSRVVGWVVNGLLFCLHGKCDFLNLEVLFLVANVATMRLLKLLGMAK